MTAEPLAVLVVDDHPMYAQGLIGLLTELGIRVLGHASDGETGVRAAIELGPDIVIMDLHMPVLDGIAATRRIVAEAPDVAVLVLSMLDDDASIVAALAAGARGYLLKEAGAEEISRALQVVAAGDAILAPKVAGVVATSLHRNVTRLAATPRAFTDLTQREDEVLDLLARGRSNPSIAEQLMLSEKTVRNYVSDIFTKINVNSRAEAVAVSRSHGYGAGAL